MVSLMSGNKQAAPDTLPHEKTNWSSPSMSSSDHLLQRKMKESESRSPQPRRLNSAGSASTQYTNSTAIGWNASASAYMGKSAYSSSSSSSRRYQNPSDYSPQMSTYESSQSISDGSFYNDPSRVSIVSMPASRTPGLQSKVYGLTADLRLRSKPSETTLPEAASGLPVKSSLLPQNQKASFSVELFAQQFDPRGYPVLLGRAASVKGIVRMPATSGCDVMMKVRVMQLHASLNYQSNHVTFPF